MKLDLNNVVLHPVLSEKSNKLVEEGKYIFKVHKNANKNMIKEALERLFEVKVTKVNIINTPGKMKRYKFRNGFIPGYKKAMITLKKGDKFDFIESTT